MMPKLPLSVLECITSAMNRVLHLDKSISQEWQKLKNKVLQIEIAEFNEPYYFIFLEEGVQLTQEKPEKVTASIKGPFIPLINFFIHIKQNSLRVSQHILIEGDEIFIEGLQTVWKDFNMDWEEHLSHYVGDVMAYTLGRCVHAGTNWLQRTFITMKKNYGEYLQEEWRLLPPKEEVEDYLESVDNLRIDVDRAQARLERLLSQSIEKVN
jgi:ubiquinone biosynthesis accessory factor UbiJ